MATSINRKEVKALQQKLASAWIDGVKIKEVASQADIAVSTVRNNLRYKTREPRLTTYIGLGRAMGMELMLVPNEISETVAPIIKSTIKPSAEIIDMSAWRGKGKNKYKHPDTGQTWGGRGRPPNWIKPYLEAQRELADMIENVPKLTAKDLGISKRKRA